VSATPEQVAWLQRVQDQVNAITYERDANADAHDLWVDEPGIGTGFECRDYVLGKARLLRTQGWPAQDMSVVLVNDELGEYHAVLACKADDETYILDNRTASIYLWNAPVYPYKWLRQQIPGTVEFRDASTGLV